MTTVTEFDFDRFAQRVAAAAPDQSDEPATSPAVMPAAPVVASLADQLESASGEAIGKVREIMAMPLDPESAHFGVIMRAQTSAAATVLTTQTRADENRLRASRGADTLALLLARMDEEESKLVAKGGLEINGS